VIVAAQAITIATAAAAYGEEGHVFSFWFLVFSF
jgi:hypothetical protein